MSTVRFYSDPHFHHKNMAVKRGFKDEIEMNEYIIKEWNNIVTKKDVTWILGDITMEKNNYEILNKLNGLKKIILGNHDLPQHVKYLLNYCNSVSSCFKIGVKELKSNVILTHIPIHESEINRFKYNIHGHVHDKSLLDKRYINVSAEVIDYKPKTLEELLNE